MKLKEHRKGERAVETREGGELNNEQREETEARALHTHPHPSRAWRQRLSPQSQENSNHLFAALVCSLRKVRIYQIIKL